MRVRTQEPRMPARKKRTANRTRLPTAIATRERAAGSVRVLGHDLRRRARPRRPSLPGSMIACAAAPSPIDRRLRAGSGRPGRAAVTYWIRHVRRRALGDRAVDGRRGRDAVERAEVAGRPSSLRASRAAPGREALALDPDRVYGAFASRAAAIAAGTSPLCSTSRAPSVRTMITRPGKRVRLQLSRGEDDAVVERRALLVSRCSFATARASASSANGREPATSTAACAPKPMHRERRPTRRFAATKARAAAMAAVSGRPSSTASGRSRARSPSPGRGSVASKPATGWPFSVDGRGRPSPRTA